ncbi:MAPEG family protein [Kordiimonas aquimaris]|uniref:MAPEG family protein n=1 Tax=Kordiimonas aquimaris TaxID=707591 RepID=UPI0021D239E1|nr:MAPEG family protein [Kordiimonas aquimaris]
MTNIIANTSFIGPVLAQIGLTLLVLFLLYARRLPAMAAIKPTNEMMQDKASASKLPMPARFAAENYNHQFEAPVLFYVLCLTAMITGLGNELSIQLAWAYVGLRVLHSIIHCTYNRVMHRFYVFALSNLVQIGLFLTIVFDYLD